MNANQITGAFCLAVILFFACDIMFGNAVQFEGPVVDGIYTPERRYVTHDSKGSHTRTDAEEWNLMILANDEAYKVRCEPVLFYKVKKGDIVRCRARKGFFTKSLYLKRAVEAVKKDY